MKRGKNVVHKNSKRHKKTQMHEHDDIVLEAETDTDMVRGGNTLGGASAEQRIKKLKKKLRDAEQKAKEHLDGWQRLKADMANQKQAEEQRLRRARERGIEAVLESLLPALDSFEAAMQGKAWESVDSAWRTGMEFVHNQLVQALAEHNVQSFGAVGDTFDTALHEAVEGEGSTITKVIRKGYMHNDTVLRPARVTIGT